MASPRQCVERGCEVFGVNGDRRRHVTGDRRVSQAEVVSTVPSVRISWCREDLEEPRPIGQRRDLIDESAVRATRHQHHVERVVTREAFDEGVATHHGIECRGHFGAEPLVASCRIERLPQCHRLEKKANGVDLVGQISIDGGDPSASLGSEVDESVPGQTPQRFTNRSGRHAPRRGEMFDRNAIARTESTGQDLGSQPFVGPIGACQRLRHHHFNNL